MYEDQSGEFVCGFWGLMQLNGLNPLVNGLGLSSGTVEEDFFNKRCLLLLTFLWSKGWHLKRSTVDLQK